MTRLCCAAMDEDSNKFEHIGSGRVFWVLEGSNMIWGHVYFAGKLESVVDFAPQATPDIVVETLEVENQIVWDVL